MRIVQSFLRPFRAFCRGIDRLARRLAQMLHPTIDIDPPQYRANHDIFIGFSRLAIAVWILTAAVALGMLVFSFVYNTFK